MAPYIWGYKNDVHLIDVSKTAFQLEKSAQFLKDLAANNKQILWIGTKKAAQKLMQEAAEKLNMPHVTHRWIGGTLSNFSQVKKSITKLLHYEDILAKAEKYPHFTKKELNVINKVAERLRKKRLTSGKPNSQILMCAGDEFKRLKKCWRTPFFGREKWSWA